MDPLTVITGGLNAPRLTAPLPMPPSQHGGGEGSLCAASGTKEALAWLQPTKGFKELGDHNLPTPTGHCGVDSSGCPPHNGRVPGGGSRNPQLRVSVLYWLPLPQAAPTICRPRDSPKGRALWEGTWGIQQGPWLMPQRGSFGGGAWPCSPRDLAGRRGCRA